MIRRGLSRMARVGLTGRAFLSLLGGALRGHLSFSPDNTWDIGTSGATPRDLTIGRTLVASGSIYCGSSGAFRVYGRGGLYSSADGSHQLKNNAGTQASSLTAAMPPAAVTAGVASPLAITDLQSGTVFGNSTATALAAVTLPTARAGLHYWFIDANASFRFRINAAAGDSIITDAGDTSAGGYAESTGPGDLIHLYAMDADTWVRLQQYGTFSVT